MFDSLFAIGFFYSLNTKFMTEETLKHVNIDGLFDLMLLGIEELLEAMKKKDPVGIRVKKKQVELLQRVIVTRKAELQKTESLQ